MGQEAVCILRLGQNVSRGTLLLESRELTFRGDPRIVIPFKEMKSVQAADGVLHVKFSGGLARFEIGPQAEKWAQKILHPPSRLDKLGVRAGLTVKLIGKFDPDFVRELGAAVSAGSPPDLLFFAAETAADLKKLPKLKPSAALWVIYPKGITAIRETDVIAAGRAAGLKDVKVVAFSSTHTGLTVVKSKLRDPDLSTGRWRARLIPTHVRRAPHGQGFCCDYSRTL